MVLMGIPPQSAPFAASMPTCRSVSLLPTARHPTSPCLPWHISDALELIGPPHSLRVVERLFTALHLLLPLLKRLEMARDPHLDTTA